MPIYSLFLMSALQELNSADNIYFMVVHALQSLKGREMLSGMVSREFRRINMKPEIKRYTTTVGSREITIETGKLAAQAGGAVTVRTGDTVIFAAATMGGVREGIDFFPFSVEYEERMYATGKIPGSFFRREGRPSTEAILTARLTDRPIRPLFPKGMRNEVQVIMYSLSADPENPIDMLGINAASSALMISDIPWDGPVAAVRVGSNQTTNLSSIPPSRKWANPISTCALLEHVMPS